MNRICDLFEIEYPVIQAGMVWCSGWRLASAVSNAGGLGLIGAGSMHPEVLREHIRKCKAATDNPFGVNVPLMYPEIEVIMNLIVEEGVKIVFTSAGSPKKWTGFLKKHGITVVHVVSSALFAAKCEEAGVDAIVAEGFEAGGHNGREETTTLCLIPSVRKATSLPLLAAGGIMGAVFVLRHSWLWERIAIWLSAGGWLMYLVTVLYLHFLGDGNRLIQAGAILFIIIALVDRYVEIIGDAIEPGY